MTKAKPDISVIIVNYNAQSFLRDTLNSIMAQKGLSTEIIVVDNNSTDNSREMIKAEFKQVVLISNSTNLGFSKANNQGVAISKAETILFLNPDVQFSDESGLSRCYHKLESDSTIGALTGRVNLVLTGKIDVTSHRGFPTPWASFTHFFGLSRLFPTVPVFNQYTKNYLGYTQEHDIDAIGGMFMLMRKSVGDEIGWWDEDYPLYGEDLDLCFRLKQAGYHNLFYPSVTLLHYKGTTTGMSKQSRSVSTADRQTTKQVKLWSIQAMEIFYQKHYAKKYPFFFNWFVHLGIKVLKSYRLHS